MMYKEYENIVYSKIFSNEKRYFPHHTFLKIGYAF